MPSFSSSSSSPTPPLGNGDIIVPVEKTLYHFGLSTLNTDFRAKFGDIKFVCTGGSAGRMENFAKEFSSKNKFPLSGNLCLTDRYAMFKTGPVLWVNHGIGSPSLSILLNELFQLLHFAGATNDVQIFRIGTCGGIGVPPGTVVLSNGTLNSALERSHHVWINGKLTKREAVLDEQLSDELFRIAVELGVPVERGITLCADDFYDGQMRADGYFNDYNKAEKMAFMEKLSRLNVKNIEMESSCFAALTHRAGIKSAICCVVLINRLEEDTVKLTKTFHDEIEMRPYQVVTEHILRRLLLKKSANEWEEGEEKPIKNGKEATTNIINNKTLIGKKVVEGAASVL